MRNTDHDTEKRDTDDQTKTAVEQLLFSKWTELPILPSREWSDDYIPWEEKNQTTPHKMKPDTHGYEVLSGSGMATGHLLGGCFDVFMMAVGTSIWPNLEQWNGAILFLETSEDKPSPDFIKYALRNLAAMGILKVLKGILFGKPQGEQFYEEYKAVLLQVVVEEEKLPDLPIFYNLNFGHAKPIGVIPYGVQARLDCGEKSVVLLECPTVD